MVASLTTEFNYGSLSLCKIPGVLYNRCAFY